MKRIVILGDSYTYGHGCSDRVYYRDEAANIIGNKDHLMNSGPSEYCWASLLQKDFPDFKIRNLSRPGNSNQSMFRNLCEFLQDKNNFDIDMILFMGTLTDRIDIGDTKGNLQPWPLGGDMEGDVVDPADGFNMAKKMYLTWLYDKNIGNYLSVMAVLACYNMANLVNAKFFYNFHGPHPYDKLFTNVTKLFKDREIHIISHFDFSANRDAIFNDSCLAPDGHVNEKGHEIYYNRIIKPLVQEELLV